jgi:hypothetical protein
MSNLKFKKLWKSKVISMMAHAGKHNALSPIYEVMQKKLPIPLGMTTSESIRQRFE